MRYGIGSTLGFWGAYGGSALRDDEVAAGPEFRLCDWPARFRVAFLFWRGVNCLDWWSGPREETHHHVLRDDSKVASRLASHVSRDRASFGSAGMM